MALDGIMLNKVVNKLNQYLPMRINKIYDNGNYEILFHVKPKSEAQILLISGQPNFNRIHFTNKAYQNNAHPNNFVMLLRKHLLNGFIIEIKQFSLDRIIRLKIQNYNDIGDMTYYHIYVELKGRFANIIFCDEKDIIFDAVRRISPLENPKTSVIPGAKYVLDYDKKKLNPYHDNDFDINESLVKQFVGFSPTLEKELRYRLKNQSFDEIITDIKAAEQFVISTNSTSDFHTIKLTHKYNQFKTYNLFAGFDEFYFLKSQNERIKQETNNLLKVVNRELKKSNRKLIKLKVELDNNQNSKEKLKAGDLIMTYQTEIKKGMKFVNLIDYDTDEPITIKLNAALDPIANAQNYYKQYQKQKRSIKYLTAQITESENEIAYLRLIKEQLLFADVKSAKEIKTELINNKYLPKKSPNKKRQSKPNFLEIKYNDFTTIRVGKNNVQNDYITFKAANRNDYWFHIKDYHGAHVTVNTTDLTPEIINLAASLAINFSEAKDLKRSEVNYSQIKNLRRTKIKGLVNLTDFETITINVDMDLINKYL